MAKKRSICSKKVFRNRKIGDKGRKWQVEAGSCFTFCLPCGYGYVVFPAYICSWGPTFYVAVIKPQFTRIFIFNGPYKRLDFDPCVVHMHWYAPYPAGPRQPAEPAAIGLPSSAEFSITGGRLQSKSYIATTKNRCSEAVRDS